MTRVCDGMLNSMKWHIVRGPSFSVAYSARILYFYHDRNRLVPIRLSTNEPHTERIINGWLQYCNARTYNKDAYYNITLLCVIYYSLTLCNNIIKLLTRNDGHFGNINCYVNKGETIKKKNIRNNIRSM